MEIIAIIDKQKLPEDIIKIIEERFSKDKAQLHNAKAQLDKILKDENKIHTNNKIIDDKIKNTDNKLYAMQTGIVVGNIYDKNFKLDDKGDT